MSAKDPYRDADVQPRYFCVVCNKAASTAPANCPRCGARLQTFADDIEMFAWIEKLRQRARRKKARPTQLLFATAGIVGGISAVAIFVILLIRLDGTKFALFRKGDSPYGSGSAFGLIGIMWPVLGLVWLYALKWCGAFKRSIAEAEQFDPEAASVRELLSWLSVGVYSASST